MRGYSGRVSDRRRMRSKRAGSGDARVAASRTAGRIGCRASSCARPRSASRRKPDGYTPRPRIRRARRAAARPPARVLCAGKPLPHLRSREGSVGREADVGPVARIVAARASGLADSPRRRARQARGARDARAPARGAARPIPARGGDRAHTRRARAAVAGRPALSRRRVAARALPLLAPVVPARRAVVARGDPRRARRIAASRGRRRVLRAADARHVRAGELCRDEPRNRAAHRAHGRREPRAGRVELSGRRPPPDHEAAARGRRAVRARPESRDDARPRRVPQSPDRAAAVQPDDARRLRAARADRARMDHEVLHPRSVGAQLAHPLPGRRRAHGVLHLVAQRRCERPRPEPRRLPQARRDGRARHDRRDRARREDPRDRLLPRRHAALDRGGRDGEHRRRSPRVDHAARRANGFRRARRAPVVHRRQRDPLPRA